MIASLNERFCAPMLLCNIMSPGIVAYGRKYEYIIIHAGYIVLLLFAPALIGNMCTPPNHEVREYHSG